MCTVQVFAALPKHCYVESEQPWPVVGKWERREQEAFSVASESEGIKWLQCRQAVVRRAEESRFEFRQLSQHSTLLLSYLLLVLFGPPAGSKNAEQGECSDWTVRAQSQGP